MSFLNFFLLVGELPIAWAIRNLKKTSSGLVKGFHSHNDIRQLRDVSNPEMQGNMSSTLGISPLFSIVLVKDNVASVQ